MGRGLVVDGAAMKTASMAGTANKPLSDEVLANAAECALVAGGSSVEESTRSRCGERTAVAIAEGPRKERVELLADVKAGTWKGSARFDTLDQARKAVDLVRWALCGEVVTRAPTVVKDQGPESARG